MPEIVDKEIEAIRCVLDALTPLSGKARLSVIQYVTGRLDMSPVDTSQQASSPFPPGIQDSSHAGYEAAPPQHIKQFKEQKAPRSANEMAALVAYYLQNLAPVDERKKTITQKDIETYFKIASFPLPKQVRFTLVNAKNSGYFDPAGAGEYRLNAVGHNLVVHSMPRGLGNGASKATPQKATRRASTTKKTRKK